MAESDPGANFNTKSMSLRMQKKIASKMSTKRVAKKLVDDTTAELLDHLHILAKKEYPSKEEAKKLVKNIIKIVVKIGILRSNDQFNAQEVKLIKQFRKEFHNVIKTAIGFHEGKVPFDRDFLISQIQNLENMLVNIVERHLQDKSQKRITFIFKFFKSRDFLDKLFLSDGEYKGEMENITTLLNKLIEEGNI